MILLFFLAEKGLLKEFEENLRDEDFNRYAYTALLNSFVWSLSNQGYSFWCRVNNEYQEFLKSME